uniref:Uncharacterized protein n=1 Tax=Timema tahoe TaxID=61484 RepID=A0A7R9NV99_9NEOP|nr:unnamed protein product [Timema tahoe]
MTHPSGWSAGSHVCKISQCRLEVSPATTLEELTLEKCRAGSVLGLIASNGRVQAFMNYHVPSHGGCPFNFGRGSNSFIDNNVDMRSTVEEAFPQQCGISSGKESVPLHKNGRKDYTRRVKNTYQEEKSGQLDLLDVTPGTATRRHSARITGQGTTPRKKGDVSCPMSRPGKSPQRRARLKR